MFSVNFEAHTLQNNFVVFFRLGVEDENGQALFSSLEAFTSKIQGKTVSTILNCRPQFLPNCVISFTVQQRHAYQVGQDLSAIN